MLHSSILHSPLLEKPRFDRRFETQSAGVSNTRNCAPEGSLTSQGSLDRHDDSEAGDLNSRFAACLRELSLVSMYLDRNLREKITRQLRNLFNVDEWDEDDVPVNVGSFRSFVRALILIEPLQRPMLALNQQGGVIAMWGENDSRFVLDFFPRDRLRWFAVSPNEDENVADKSVGETSIEKLGGIIDAFGARGLIDGAG